MEPARLGRAGFFPPAPISLFLKVAKSPGIPEFVIEELYWFLMDYQRNAFGLDAPTQTVLEVSGVPAEPFEQMAQRYVAASGFARRTMGSHLTAAHNLVTGVLTKAPVPAAIARRLLLPVLNHPTLAVDSGQWRASHAPDLATSRSST